jgi:diguanylate cyclase (GGDEF)-like protein/PAS domain S-box-containing protein
VVATYDPWVVGLSVVIAILASYTALDLASRVTAAERRTAVLWILGGAFSMGIGIWSMHFIGMLAYQLPIPLAYDAPTTLLSMVPAVGISALALSVIRRRSTRVSSLILAGVLMGIGIVAMHYTGMAAMRMQPAIQYDPGLFALSVLIAIGAATAALWIAGLLQPGETGAKVLYQKLGSAVVMGLAISGMHYTGMAAANVAPGSVCLVTPYGVASQWLAVLVGAGTFVILSVTLLVSVFDARLAHQAQRMLADLRGVQAFLSSIVESMPSMVFVKDAVELRFLHFNRAGERLTGYSREQLIGKNDYDFFPKEQADFFVARDREVLATRNELVVAEEPITRTDGTTRLLRTVKLAIPDDQGKAKYLLGISEDITDRRHAEEQLRIAARAFENTADGVIIYDAQRRIVSVNKSFSTVTGYQEHEVVGKHAEFLRSDKHDRAFFRDVDNVVDENGRWQGEMMRRRKNGEVFPSLCSVSAVKDARGAITNYVTVFNDISSFKEYEAKLEFIAHHDSLTGLPNRALFQERFRQALTRARRRDGTVAVLFVDLDQFKTINDSLGHHVGDKLLQVVATRLQTCVRETDVVARLGGDEFTIMVDDLRDSQDAGKIAEKLLSVLADPIELDEHNLVMSASIGISCYPHDGPDAETLLKNADAAMYAAKEGGRKTFQYFKPEMNEQVMKRVQIEAAMRRALERGEFLLHYQPKVEIATGAIHGVEALLRWAHPDHGLVLPAEFIPVLEETGLIVPVGEWVAREACRQIRAWQQAGLKVPPVAVNLSARQFQEKNLERTVSDILRQTGVAPELLQLEITESMLMNDPEAAEGTLRALKAAGVKLSIDDFGTGYSSLAYLRRFPLDILKIDRAFIKDMVDNPDDAAITLAVISLAHSLGLKVVAEGVETEAQANLLALHSCDELQGYYFSKPLPAAALEAMLREDRRLVRSESWVVSGPAVLLLDDNEDDLRLLQHALRSGPFQVLTATTAEKAFALLASHAVSVVVSDQRMPGMDGAEFLAKLRKLHPHALRIAISGADDAQTVANAVNEAGIYKFLSKKWSSERLCSEVLEAYRRAATNNPQSARS